MNFAPSPTGPAPDVKGDLLRVEGLTVTAGPSDDQVSILDDVNFSIRAGSIAALVGESGCGKSMTALAIMRILGPGLQIVGGRLVFDDQDLVALPDDAMNALRGSALTMVFQDPSTALNPVLTIGEQLMEGIVAHKAVTPAQARSLATEMLRSVRISRPEQRMREWPHQLSGGMRQRVMIGMAIACAPKLIIADEPTTALDATIQLQILALLKDVQRQTGAGILLITHNLGVVAEMADDVVVMYAGRVVERGPADRIFGSPTHPYTRGLFAATPRFVRAEIETREPLQEIAGLVPPPGERLAGCAFAPRCPIAQAMCREQRPPLATVGDQHAAACWFPGGPS
jgi:oligopeptide/dipeptide ABC transporter ATP-binding protein